MMSDTPANLRVYTFLQELPKASIFVFAFGVSEGQKIAGCASSYADRVHPGLMDVPAFFKVVVASTVSLCDFYFDRQLSFRIQINRTDRFPVARRT
jgi:hypothetical protein